MRDQASELRNLVLRSMRQAAAARGPAPRLVVMAGGNRSVGTTTLAVNAAVSMSQNGMRVVLVDAAASQPGVAKLCGLGESEVAADVALAGCDIHEILKLGPAGIQVVPASQCSSVGGEDCEKSQLRLIQQLKTLGRYADVVLVDVGSGVDDVMQRFWQAADTVVLVTTPNHDSVMEAYSTIKSLTADSDHAPIRVVVNQALNEAVGDDVVQRIANSCRRFLNVQVDSFTHVPADRSVSACADRLEPIVLRLPASPAAQAIANIAARLSYHEQVPASNKTSAAA